jgi:methionyl-tRNA formyltransferase
VLAAEVANASANPGTVVDDRLTIACAVGALRPLRVQRAGKAAVGTDAFLRGFALPEETLLS